MELACLLILFGLIALTVGAELLVRGACRLAATFGISSLIIGLTVVAFGTSAPELAVSVSSALIGKADIALGNVVGSNIFNVLFILGLSAFIVPLAVDQKLVRFDIPLMIGVSVVVWGLGLDRVIGRLDGLLLCAGLLAYTTWCIFVGHKESQKIKNQYDEAFQPESAMIQPQREAVGHQPANLPRQLALIIAGLVLLVLGAGWLVNGATGLARRMGVSELVISLTIVAGGTSLPELATSIVAALRGERDIAVGNIVGSNLFNILGVLGLSAVVAPDGVAAAEQAMQFDIPVMIVVASACLPVFFTGHVIARWEGALFFGYYIAYTIALVLMATQSEALPLFRLLMIGFAIPLTVITLAILVTHAVELLRCQEARRRFAIDDATTRVVVLGGGFGGLSVVRSLAGVPARITLIDRRNFHLFQPLLYQVATGSLSPANISTPLRNLLRRQWNCQVRMGEAIGIDLEHRVVQLAGAEKVPFDLLVVSMGVRHSYFGHPEWESVAPGLKTIEDATDIRRRILSAFEAAEYERDGVRRHELLTFVIVGGGPTGVELAGSLAEIARYTLECEFRSINPSDARILLIEAADRILTGYPVRLSAKARSDLERLGVTVRCHTRVVSVSQGRLTLAGEGLEETLHAPTILWAAGVETSGLAQSLARQSGAATDRAGRIAVSPDLTLPGHADVFVIGDGADCRDPHGRQLPGTAPVAIQQGKYVAREIRRRLRARPPAATASPRPFHYRHQGSLTTIGRSAAVAHFGRCHFSGFPAWLLWLVIHIAKLNQLENRVLVFVQWMWSFFTFGRSARLITGTGAGGTTSQNGKTRPTA